MSISYDDLNIVDCQTYDSLSDMSFPTIRAPASVVSFDNDLPGPGLPPPDPLTLSDIDDDLSVLSTLNSFIPILRHLPGLYLDQNLYYICGPVATADWKSLRHYARTVSKFILTDEIGFGPSISPALSLRLARLQEPGIPLFPSLSDLVIVDADASIAYLELLLTPSLKSLKASCIPDPQQSTFLSFLTAIKEEAPFLQTLILGPGRFLPKSLQTISQFNDLGYLELKLENSELPLAFFDNVGALPKLETFILDARHVSSNTAIKNQSNNREDSKLTVPPTPALADINPLPSGSSNSMDGNRKEDGAVDQHLSLTITPISTYGSFDQLAKLHVIGWSPLLQDLISRIMSARLEDVSVTLIRLSDDELAKEKAADEEKQRRDRANTDPCSPYSDSRPSSPLKKKKKYKRLSSEERWLKERLELERLEQERLEQERLEPEWLEQERREQEWLEQERLEQERLRLEQEQERLRLEQERLEQEERLAWQEGLERVLKEWKERLVQDSEAQERLQKEQEELTRTSVPFDAVSFIRLLQTLYCRWTTSLKAVSVCQLSRSFQPLLNPQPTLPEEMFRGLLLLPAIESLEVKGWTLSSVERILSAARSIPNLKSFLLPLEETNSGISFSTLRRVAGTCPKLESFQCRINSLSLIPEYTVPTTEALSHGLQWLSVGNSSPLFDTKRLSLIARHLYLLFPNLKTINTSEEHNAEQWVIVDELVKMCQTARVDDMNRPIPIT